MRNWFGAGTALATATLMAMMTVGAANADEPPLSYSVDELVTDSFVAGVRQWAMVPVVTEALRSRNERTGRLSQDRIDELDRAWRDEREKQDQPLITSVLANPVSSYLYRIQATSVGLFTEVFVMDQNGMNLGQSAITSDYWQGDEAKFQKTFQVGSGAVFVDEPEFHKETQTWRAQLNMTVDGSDGRPAGAITVEVNLTELERRTLAGIGS